MSKIDHSLFQANAHALQQAYGDCPECGAPLHVRHGKSGNFLGCSTYPQCHFSKPLHETETTEIKRIEGAVCPECGGDMAIKKGRFGLFIGCCNFPQCHHIASLQEKTDTHVTCPLCHEGHLLKRTNKFGKAFYACNAYPKCKYVVNHPPVNKACPQCGWAIMCEKNQASESLWVCPQRDCQYKMPAETET
ncbi:topoisomerase DNA-binding C4 zinc finger domain-containing protein [Aestuariibacter halophilus]|uniref:Topoisomerase DNA-binding C4 zinc finger domain-containing protein n=1 Tax=Fluctibacter halophilus TaxID=226011 RepID=A0ABS8G8I5_9ALTE|nr:topoisomerase DNA-binding C4 zinc finger domain-containing protein [Aestuariibacter halophilus]MCC2616892.1 topoisomerase DNA-binding C4 zinc finger domain-containing protein [Aestuariibacter halophilus]